MKIWLRTCRMCKKEYDSDMKYSMLCPDCREIAKKEYREKDRIKWDKWRKENKKDCPLCKGNRKVKAGVADWKRSRG